MTGARAAEHAALEGVQSRALQRLLSGLTSNCLAILSAPDGSATFTTFKLPDRGPSSARVHSLPDAGKVDLASGFRVMAGRDRVLETLRLNVPTHEAGNCWRGFACTLQGGTEDRVALELDPETDLRLALAFLDRIWRIVREDCFDELKAEGLPGHRPRAEGMDPLLWMVLDRMDVALIILDGKGLMYRMNAAGQQLLDEALVLKRGRGGIFAALDAESCRFRAEVADCAASGTERTIFLANSKDGRSVPINIARYRHRGAETRYVVVTVPRPPDPDRIEQLARQRGLTPAESRVARLMQLGLSNREAAELAGISQQTFNTYAKRVLSKLNVGGRTEMAQLLTWQAAGGRLS